MTPTVPALRAVSVGPGPDRNALIGRDRHGQALAVVTTTHLTVEQRADLAQIYRMLAALIDPGAQP